MSKKKINQCLLLTFEIENFSLCKKSKSYQSFPTINAVILEIKIFTKFISAESGRSWKCLEWGKKATGDFEFWHDSKN